MLQVGVCPGRPVRLQLHEFKVDKVQLKGLQSWRKLLAREPEVVLTATPIEEWASYAVTNTSHVSSIPDFGAQSPGFIAPMLSVATPPGDDLTFVVPALPLGYFYLALLDERGGHLESRWLTHVFPTDVADDDPRYDKAKRIKKLELGTPQEVELQVKGRDGRAIPGARLVATNTMSNHGMHREYRSDEKGFCKVSLPGANQGIPGSVSIEPCDPDRHSIPLLVQFQAAQPGQAASPPLALVLQDAVAASWKIENAMPLDRFFFARDELVLPLHLGGDGTLDLPFERHRSWSLLLDRGGRGVLLHAATGASAAATARSLDLQRLRTGTVSIRSAGGTGVRGGFVEVHRKNDGASATGVRAPIDGDGRCELTLLPGEYVILAWHPRRGDGLVEIEVEESKMISAEITLRPFARTAGQIVHAGKVPPRVLITSAAVASPRSGSIALQRLAALSNRSVRCEEDGRFEILVSSHAAQVSLQASGLIDGKVSHARVSCTPGDSAIVKISM